MSRMNMDLRTAKHIVVLAKHLNFTRAAQEIGLTQSALSRSIQQLENNAGVKLFDRNRAAVHLTALGKIVESRAALLLRQAEEVDRLLEEAANGRQTRVQFGMGRTAAAALLPQVVSQELDTGANVEIDAVVRSFDNLVELLLAERIEFFVCAEQPVPRGAPIKAMPIALFSMTHMVRPDHPLLGATELAAFKDYPWMISSGVADPTFPRNAAWPHLQDRPQIVIEDLSCAARLAETTDMIWLSSSFSAIREIEAGRLRLLPLPPDCAVSPYRLMFYSPKGRSLSPAATRLWRTFKDLAAQLAKSVER